eukprot:9498197-Pyramimonas_sp.AAC.1
MAFPYHHPTWRMPTNYNMWPGWLGIEASLVACIPLAGPPLAFWSLETLSESTHMGATSADSPPSLRTWQNRCASSVCVCVRMVHDIRCSLHPSCIPVLMELVEHLQKLLRTTRDMLW